MNVELFTIEDGARLADALAIRLRVFVLEQSVPLEEEVDVYDAARTTVHALARRSDGEDPIGTGRFYMRTAASVQIGRMAVERTARGTGAGAAILAALVREAASRGYTEAYLLAQLTAVGFYAKFGFRAYGQTVLDAGIEHVQMSRMLTI